MKKILSIMLAIILNLNIALGYTSTIIIKGVSIKVTGEEGSIVNIRSKLPEATGWEVKTNNTTVNANGEFIMPAEDVIIEAIIPDVLTYLLTIGNEYFDRRENKPAGEIVTVEADSSDGSFVFVSWTVEGIELTESQKVSEAITFTMPENSVTLIANYIEAGQEYTVTFDANGGSGTMEPQTFIVGTPQNLKLNTFTNTGKTFAGWSREPNATTNELTDGQSYNGTGNITLYAVWTTDAYTITYDLDGGTVTGNPGTYSVDTETITLINPTKEGYTFLGWTGSNGSTPSTTVTIPKGSTGNKTYTANWQINNYTIEFNPNGGTGTMANQTFTPNETKNLTTNTFTKDNYVFKGWSTSSTATVATYTDGQSYTATGNITLYAVWEEFKWNAPVIATGLTPVNWNGSSWVTTTVDNWDYNYEIATANHNTVAGDGTGKWANAQTSDGSLYVWIPRYTYKITSGYHSSGNSWSSVDSAGTNKIEIKFSNGIQDEVTSGATNASQGYIKHPAFTFGTDELKGIWVAKYEASRKNATSSSEGTNNATYNIPTSKPGVVSWRSLTVSDMYSYAYNLNRTLDSHLMKNSEWGAAVYLTNAVGKIPYINNISSYITGNAGGTQNAVGGTVSSTWNTANGVKSSTTHNVYGIYDLSGGSFEYVSAYYTGGSNSYMSNLITNKNTKYVETYSTAYASNKIGDAVYETSSNSADTQSSWDGAYSNTIGGYVFERGGHYNSMSGAGAFCFYVADGNGSVHNGFRVVLAIP